MGKLTFFITLLFGMMYLCLCRCKIRMMGTSPCKDGDEIRRDLVEVRRAMTLSFIGAPPILIGPSSEPIEALIGHSACSKLVGKQTKSWDISCGFPILKGTLFARHVHISLEDVE